MLCKFGVKDLADLLVAALVEEREELLKVALDPADGADHGALVVQGPVHLFAKRRKDVINLGRDFAECGHLGVERRKEEGRGGERSEEKETRKFASVSTRSQPRLPSHRSKLTTSACRLAISSRIVSRAEAIFFPSSSLTFIGSSRSALASIALMLWLILDVTAICSTSMSACKLRICSSKASAKA